MKIKNNEDESTIKIQSSSVTEILKKIGIVISVFSTLLMVLGYGVALEAESMFGIPHASLYESIFDSIDLGSFVVIPTAFVAAMELINLSTLDQIYQKYYIQLLISAAIVSVLFLLLFFLNKRRPLFMGDISKKFNELKKSILKCKARIVYAWMMSVIGLYPIFLMAGVILIAGLLLILVLIPFTGGNAAGYYFKEWVIDAELCKQAYSSKEKLLQNTQESNSNKRKSTADCVIVTNDKDEVGRGYVVLSTSKNLLLYNPKNRETLRIPIENAKIQTVSDLSKNNQTQGTDKKP